MRNLPYKPTEKQKLIIEAVKDYFGEINTEEQKSARKISLWLMGKRRGIDLTEEEKEIMETMRTNLQDKVYASGLVDNPQLEMRSGELRPQFSLINSDVSP